MRVLPSPRDEAVGEAVRTRSKKPKPPKEHDEQVVVCEYLDMRHVCYFAVPNGGSRHKVEAKRMKRAGVKSGVPDLILPGHRIAVEMKRTSGSKTSPEQLEWVDKLRLMGWRVYIATGATDAIGWLGSALLRTGDAA